MCEGNIANKTQNSSGTDSAYCCLVGCDAVYFGTDVPTSH